MKWKLIILGLLAAFLLALCLRFHFGRINRSPVYETKIESGFKATIDKKKGTITIIRPKTDASGGERGKQTNALQFSRRGELDYDEGTKTLRVFAPRSGFVFEPGVSAMCGSEGAFRLGLDVQGYFYKRWGIVGGVSGRTSQGVRPRVYLAVAYAPSWRFTSNTSFLIGMDTQKDWYVGIRIGL